MELFIIIGTGLIISGLFSHFHSKTLFSQVETLKTLGATPIKELKELFAGNPDKDSFKQASEISGIISDDITLKNEYSGLESVYCKTVEIEHYEESYYTTVNKKNVRKSRRGTKIINNKTEWVNFKVIDKEGNHVFVNPEGIKKLDLVTAHNLYKPFNQPSGRDYKILGHTKEEKALLTNTQVYIAGELKIENNELTICNPSKETDLFIISTKDKNDVVKSKQQSAVLFKNFTYLLPILGVISVLIAIFGNFKK